MATIKTIKPDGTGDFTTIQAWEDWADGEASAAQWAECYSGGNLGTLLIGYWVATPNSSNYAKIYAAPGHTHGLRSDLTCATVSWSAGIGFDVRLDYTRVEGLLFLGSGSAERGVYMRDVGYGSANMTCRDVIVKRTGVSHTQASISGDGNYQKVVNCVCYQVSGEYGFFSVKAYNCVSVSTNDLIQGFRACDVAKNCMAFGSTTWRDFLLVTTQAYNISQDTSASGTGSLTGRAAINQFIDPASNWNLLTTSEAKNAGTNVSGENGGISVDGIGTARPQGAQWDIGASEFIIVSPPVAAFVGTPLTGQVPLLVNFTDQSTNTPTGWDWDFGDGGVSTSQNPSHTFSTPGTYTVSLDASNAGGSDSEIKIAYITATAPPPSGSPLQGLCQGLGVGILC